MSNYLVTDTELTQTANAIRTKAGSAASIPFASGTGFKSAIEALPSGGGATITPTAVVDTMEGRKASISAAVSGFAISASVTTE